MRATWRGVLVLAVFFCGFSIRTRAQSQTIFTSQTPQLLSQSDGSNVNYELGAAFQSNASGQITAIRFWKDSRETGSHTGRIWSTSGKVLASVSFTNESGSGWQMQALPAALSVSANTTYVVTVNTGNTYYVETMHGLSSQVNNQHLSTIVGANGVYGSVGQFPTSTWNGSNYFRDVVFAPSGATSNYSISGNISGSGGNGATIALSGAGSATTTANSSGAYTFTGLASGSYTVTPSHSGFTFSPASQNVTVNGGNITAPSFTSSAATQSYSISGTISGSRASGATVTLSGAASATTTANSSGNYSFTGLANGSYTVTPSKSGVAFSPTSQNVTVNGSNVTVAAFTTTTGTQTYSISGTITGSGGNGATVALSGAASATTTANSSGGYTFTGLSSGNYTVTPSHSGFTFSPANQNVTINGASVTVAAFTATASTQTFSISGTITGSGGNGATVSLSGPASATTTANSSGSYTFTGLSNGKYAVTPSHSGFNFSPTVQSVTVSGSNATVPAFTATAASPTFSISGTITPSATGSGATITLSGASSGTTTANSSGSFSFTGLANGSYTVTPSSASASFSPTSRNVTINGANGSVSFTATASSSVILYDDFTSASLDTTIWYPMDQFGYSSNGEQQCYLPAQDTVANGMLVLTTIASKVSCPPYGGGSAQSASYASGELYSAATFLYGTIEYRAQMAGGQGAWPAIWMLGHNCHPSGLNQPAEDCPWPQPGSDEIDITEIMNQNVTSINQEIHSSAGSPQCTASGITDVTKNFHVYDLIWTSKSLTWKVDGVTTCTTTQAVPQQAMFLIINNAVGGNGGGGTINGNSMPWNMYVDYVKITQP